MRLELIKALTALIALSGVNPILAYQALFAGAFLDYYGLGAKLSPLLLAGPAVAVPIRAGPGC